jgi:imidazolonepropionase-like amidohydrolase
MPVAIAKSLTASIRKFPALLALALASVALPALAAPVASGAATESHVAAGGTLVLDHLIVIDGTGAAPRADHSLVIERGRIVAVAPTASLDVPSGTRRDNLCGHWAIPGLVDMHAHVAFGPVTYRVENGLPSMSLAYDLEASRAMAAEMLRWGVTTIRNPAGPTAHALRLRDDLNAGRVFGPRVHTAGDVIDRIPFEGLNTVASQPEAVAAAVESQVAAGVDFVKLYATLTPPLVRAGVEAARRSGTPTILHSWFTDWREAAELGVANITHAMPMSANLLPAERRAEFAPHAMTPQAMYRWFEFADLGGPEMTATYRAMAERGVVHDPTLVAIESMFFGDQPRIRDNPEIARVPESLARDWRSGFSLTMTWTPEDHARAAAVFPRVLELVRRLHEAGVPLTAGSDLAMPWLAPGASLHRELELLVEAGIPPLDVLRIATGNAGRALGRRGDLGTLTPGALADVVVLGADPVADIRNTRAIERVYREGVLAVSTPAPAGSTCPAPAGST